jgi:crotonobetaine/carnitine-CoA ligase
MSVDISGWTLVDLVRRQAEAYGEREFIAFEHGTSLTFAGLDRESSRLARNLAELGVGKEDRVFAILKNRMEFLLSMFATIKLGAIFVPVNTELKGAFLQHQLRIAEPTVVFVDAVLANAFEHVAGGDANLLATVFAAGAVPENPAPILADKRLLTFEQFSDLGGDQGDVLVEPKPQDIAMIMYTSGTTGPSKGVLMPHAHCYLFGDGMAKTLKMGVDDCQYICMPIFHAMGLLLQVLSALIVGSRAFCIERFSPARWLDDVRSSGATVTNALGVVPEFIFRTPETEFDQHHKLRRIVAVPIATEWGEAFEKRFNIKFLQAYGMTEVNIPTYTNEDDPLMPGMAGHIREEYFEVQVVDSETDEPVPQGEIGEIVVRPKIPFCFNQGYFRMPERTVEAWRNLWFHTGDAGYFDTEGRLFYAERIKDRIRRRGENISPFEIEQVLNDHPEINESAVIGVRADDQGGEDEVKACIVTDNGEEIDNIALLDYCVERIPRFAVPRYIEAMNDIPKTATGKIQKEELRNAGITNRTWDRESVGYKIARR